MVNGPYHLIRLPSWYQTSGIRSVMNSNLFLHLQFTKMKKTVVIFLLFVLNEAQGQMYFQRRFNLSATPNLRNERFNGGIITKLNYDAANPYFYVGLGTSNV